jgi:oligopeptide/dipeptide ABC transporter ATP-binding protein
MIAPAGGETLLRLDGVVKHYPVGATGFVARSRHVVRAVDGVSLELRRGETFSIVGETGCGKTTLARCVLRLTDVTAGTIVFEGYDITNSTPDELRPVRRRMQAVFQDPYGSLNPRHRAGSIIGEPLAIHGLAAGVDRARRVGELMELVGLDPRHHRRFPAEFSGGQRQRISIARALALKPELLICDEPVSALDVSIRAQILNLLADLQRELGLTLLFISHDLAVVRHMSDRVAVMYLGRIVETADTAELFTRPRHPYTKALLDAVPVIDADAADSVHSEGLTGEPPSPMDPPAGCRFHPRCDKVQGLCAKQVPALEPRLDDSAAHVTACHFPLERRD